jgi:pyrroline-5-carboxylate reductase
MTQVPVLPSPTWFVGCGNMGGAIIDGWRSAGISPSNVVVIRPSGKAVGGARVVTSFADAGPAPKLVVLAFKPQKLDEIAPQLKTWLTSKTTLISLLAGVEVDSLKARFPKAGAIVRALPNLPVAVRRGVIALFSKDADDEVRQQIANIVAPLGFAPWMTDEAKCAAVGAVAGAGPAYVARFIDALIKAGEQRGLSNEMASTIALETVFGTAWMAAANNEGMDSIARRVASPKGTTEAGLAILDKGQALDQLISLTIDAAARRGTELANEAKLAALAEPERLS